MSYVKNLVGYLESLVNKHEKLRPGRQRRSKVNLYYKLSNLLYTADIDNDDLGNIQPKPQKKSNRKTKPFRVTHDLFSGRFFLYDDLATMRAVPVEPLTEEIVMDSRGKLVLIHYGNGQGEMQLLNEHLNVFKTIKWKSVDPSFDVSAHWENLKREGLRRAVSIPIVFSFLSLEPKQRPARNKEQ